MSGLLIRENAGTAKDHAQNVIGLARITGTGFNAIVFKCILNEDNDGAPNCYGPLDMTRPTVLDDLANGTNNGAHKFAKGNRNFIWRAVVARRKGEFKEDATYKLDTDERLEDESGRFPVQVKATRFYVSKTPLMASPSLPEWDPNRYLDARTVPYGAFSLPLVNLGVNLGDLGFAIRGDKRLGKGFVFGDRGVQDKVGEVSRAVFRTFFPRVDQEHHPVTFFVFPGVRAGSFDATALDNAARRMIRTIGQTDNPDHLVRFLSFPPTLYGSASPPPVQEPMAPPPKDASQMDQLRYALRKPPGPDAPYAKDYWDLLTVLRQFGFR